jgi:predicted nucleic acid-binding protein
VPWSPGICARSPNATSSSQGARLSSGACRLRSIASAPVIVSTARQFTNVRFVDTNVLLYAISSDPQEREKAARANEVLASRDIALSVQVLQEFFVQATRESRSDRLTDEQAATLVESFRRFPVQENTVAVLLAAIATKRRFAISYWDAAIIEAGRCLGCDVVLSEDLSDRQDYAGVQVENPFRDC